LNIEMKNKMHRTPLFLILSLAVSQLSGQINIRDSFNLILQGDYPDTVKIDRLNSSIVQFAPNHPEEIIPFAEAAIGLSADIKDSARLALSYNRKGVAFYYLGDYNTALDNYFQAQAINERLGGLNLWRDYNNIGLVLRNLEQNEEALVFFHKSLEIQPNNPTVEANIMNNIGIAYRGLKVYDKARESLEKALAINQEIGDQQGMAHNLNNLGTVNFYENKTEIAIGFFNKALEINRQLLNRYEEVQNLNNLAEAYLKNKNYSLCLVNLSKASQILKDIRADHLTLENLELQAKYFAKIKKYDQALFIREKYSQLRDSISAESRIKQFNQLKNLANAEKEIQKVEFLKRISAIQEEKIRNQRLIQIGAVIFILIIFFTLINVLRNLNIKKKLNFSLKNQSDELATLNEELQSTIEELITQREELEKVLEDLKNTQAQLIKSEKMASLGVLSAGIAHEINNPLNFIKTGILGLEEYIHENLKEHSERLKPMTEGIHSGVDRVADIVSSMKHYSRKENDIQSSCDIHSIINHCLTILQNQFKHKIVLHKNYTNYQCEVNCNEGKLHQAILNILDNAGQSIEKNGIISITTAVESSYFTISIKDNGCGIKEEDLEKITDPFFSTKEPGKGTGLGLSITHNIIEDHKGKLVFNSEVKKGTEVIVYLPINNVNS
jgi:signal transduction histidine kinase/Tfp pilus assembly protein PilF